MEGQSRDTADAATVGQPDLLTWKPTQTRGEHTNSTQRFDEAGDQIHDLLALVELFNLHI